MTDLPEFLTIEDVAREFRMSERAIRRHINATDPDGPQRPFPGWKRVGGKYMTTRDNLRAWFDAAPNA